MNHSDLLEELREIRDQLTFGSNPYSTFQRLEALIRRVESASVSDVFLPEEP